MEASNADIHDPFVQSLLGILGRREPYVPKVDQAHPAGVLVILYRRNKNWQLLFNLRSQFVSHHKGEIAFPGGAKDEVDSNMLACALREAQEEMGIQPQDVTVLGQLDSIATRTGFLIYPFVGCIPYPYAFKVDRREVAEVLEVPLVNLMSSSTQRKEAHLKQDGVLEKITSYFVDGRLIYGATAMMVTQLLEIMKSTPTCKSLIETKI